MPGPRRSRRRSPRAPSSTQRYAEVEARFEGVDVELPPHWGGYRVVPEVVEFWQGRRGRMHDRLVYRRGSDGWQVVRLAP